MENNKYDDPKFFNEYKKMMRSQYGLDGAGEWHELRKMLPNFNGKNVLDLGCGYGWHCMYAVENGAKYVLGIDSSEKMLEEAERRNNLPLITYKKMQIENINFKENSFDIVISSLTFHYIKCFDEICKKVKECLIHSGDFIFSVEHPIFTSCENQDWIYNENGEIIHWPIDNYFSEGLRKTNFLGHEVIKYHKTLTTLINTLIDNGFNITKLVEPKPDKSMIDKMPDELRRPMMLLISAKKNKNKNRINFKT